MRGSGDGTRLHGEGRNDGRPTRILVNEHLLPHQKLDVYRVARELAQRVHAAKIRDRELRDQATRASKSCFLRLCEGLPNEGAALRHKYFVESRNSLAETVGAMDLAAAIGVVRQDDANAVQELGSRLRRMLSALMR
jgi:four helix bundle protein